MKCALDLSCVFRENMFENNGNVKEHVNSPGRGHNIKKKSVNLVICYTLNP